ncbi:hypothetical protein BDP27DRAFT_1375530 [Rhodocollybia butyracea]|uniref:Uncharacterized protein n=1 Tax=Rhodocollybia butyracea TaxID=206335 RepID=A0A9P5TV10_9AGAR|nr:hypothetical protein BDP27DRAFT_1375530 [Rhodocollybia butyracea]
MQDSNIIKAWTTGAVYLHHALSVGGKSGVILALKGGLLEALWKLSQVAEQCDHDDMDRFGRLLNSPVTWAQKIESGSEIKSRHIWSQFKQVIEGRIRFGNECEMGMTMCSNSENPTGLDTAKFVTSKYKINMVAYYNMSSQVFSLTLSSARLTIKIISNKDKALLLPHQLWTLNKAKEQANPRPYIFPNEAELGMVENSSRGGESESDLDEGWNLCQGKNLLRMGHRGKGLVEVGSSGEDFFEDEPSEESSEDDAYDSGDNESS